MVGMQSHYRNSKSSAPTQRTTARNPEGDLRSGILSLASLGNNTSISCSMAGCKSCEQPGGKASEMIAGTEQVVDFSMPGHGSQKSTTGIAQAPQEAILPGTTQRTMGGVPVKELALEMVQAVHILHLPVGATCSPVGQAECLWELHKLP